MPLDFAVAIAQPLAADPVGLEGRRIELLASLGRVEKVEATVESAVVGGVGLLVFLLGKRALRCFVGKAPDCRQGVARWLTGVNHRVTGWVRASKDA